MALPLFGEAAGFCPRPKKPAPAAFSRAAARSTCSHLYFEATSGFGTVGLSAGVTQTLSAVSKFAVSCAMFAGRVGPVSLGLALTLHKGHHGGSVLPEGKVIVG